MPDAEDGAEGEERRSSAQGDSSGNRLRGNCYEGSGCPTTSSQASAWEKDAACPGCVTCRWGGKLRDVKRPACDVTADRRMVRRRSSAQGATSVGELRDVKRPACFQRQTGACRGGCPATSVASQRMSKPRPSCQSAMPPGMRSRSKRQTCLQQTDALRPTGGGRGAESSPSQLSRRRKRSTPTARPVSSE